MILRDGISLRQLWPRTRKRLLVLVGFDCAVAALYVCLDWRWLSFDALPLGTLGSALAIFLAFRANAAYGRWWEARQLWGQLVNTSRALARQALTLTEWAPKSPEAQRFVRALIAHAHAFRHQLRGTDATDDLQRLLVPADLLRVLPARWKPVVIQQLLGDQLHAARRSGELPDILSASMEQSFNTLGDAIGGCERIAGTPIPLTFSVMVHRTIYFYCTLLPFALVGTIGWYAPVFAVFVAYTFMALEAIAEELEAPFGFDDNDLALGAICDNIEASLLEMLGEPLPPLKPIPVDFVVH